MRQLRKIDQHGQSPPIAPASLVKPQIGLRCIRLLALSLALYSVAFGWRVYADTGLFLSLGGDYVLYLAQSLVFKGDHPEKMYDRATVSKPAKQILDRYVHDPGYRHDDPEFSAEVVPYPPLFAWLMSPFAQEPLAWRFALWSLLNVATALIIAERIAGQCPGMDKPSLIMLMIGAYPFMLNLQAGQVQLFIALFITEFYIALRKGNDFQAGMWLGCVLLKPSYATLFIPLIIWKGRWMAVAGVATVALILLVGSLGAAGRSALLAYPSAFSEMAKFRGDDPSLMINWRSLVLNLQPDIYWRNGMILTFAMGMVTVGIVAWVWKGPWRTHDDGFAIRMLITAVATLVAGYHSHPYGAVIIVMPLVAVIVSHHAGCVVSWATIVGATLPSLIFMLGYPDPITADDIYTHLLWASRVFKFAIFALFGWLCLSWQKGSPIGV